MNKEYYARYAIHERSHWWFLARESILKFLIKKIVFNNKLKPIKILNVGAATGRTTEWLKEFGTVVTLEYDQDCCDYLIEEKNIEAIQGSITELPFEDSSFDLVCAFDVIEHVEDHVKGISEMHRVLKLHGFCYITVPALMRLWSSHDVVNQHFRRYNKKGLLEVVNSKFSTINKISYFNFFLFPLIWLVRLFGKFKKDESIDSDFDRYKTSGIVNAIFKFVFSLEKHILKYVNLPIGVSLLTIARKN